MFDMLPESGHRSSIVPSWGKGVALTLHVLVLGALWRAPASPATVTPVTLIESFPTEPVRPPIGRLPPIPNTAGCEGIIPMSPPEIPRIPEGVFSTPIDRAGVPRAADSGTTLVSGGGVYSPQLVQDAPELLAAPEPVYPPLLRSAGVQGRVVVAAVVDTLGQAEAGSVRIVLSDNPGFDAAALATVRAARFRPAQVYGRTVRVLVLVPVVFRLN